MNVFGRFSKLFSMIREGRAVFFYALDEKRQIEKTGTEQTARYRAALVDAGVHVLDCCIGGALQATRVRRGAVREAFAAAQFFDEVDVMRPGGRGILDSAIVCCAGSAIAPMKFAI